MFECRCESSSNRGWGYIIDDEVLLFESTPSTEVSYLCRILIITTIIYLSIVLSINDDGIFDLDILFL